MERGFEDNLAFVIFNPFATAKDALKEEKLPGPLFTRTVNSVPRLILCFFKRFNWGPQHFI